MQKQDKYPGGHPLVLFCFVLVPFQHFFFNLNFDQHLDEATILEEAQNLDMEKSLEILKSHGTVQVCLQAFAVSRSLLQLLLFYNSQ